LDNVQLRVCAAPQAQRWPVGDEPSPGVVGRILVEVGPLAAYVGDPHRPVLAGDFGSIDRLQQLFDVAARNGAEWARSIA
jgi:hypothetical protein